jgi:hypothetical protein
MKTIISKALIVLLSFFCLNVFSIYAQDDLTSEPTALTVTQPDEQVEEGQIPSKDVDVVSSLPPNEEQMNQMFSSELAEIKALRKESSPFQGEVNALNKEITNRLKQSRPELFVYGDDGFMSPENRNAIMDLIFEDPEYKKAQAELDTRMAEYLKIAKTIEDKMNNGCYYNNNFIIIDCPRN